MLPFATREAKLLFALATTLVGIGLALSEPLAVALGSAAAMSLVVAAALTAPLGRRVRHERLEFAWWLDRSANDTRATIVPGAPFRVRCFIRHRGARPLDLVDVRPLATEALAVEPAPEGPLSIGAGSRTEFTISMSARSTGRVVLHGLAVSLRGPLGLFAMPLYFPNPLVVRVLPKTARLHRRGSARTGYATHRGGRAQLRRRGGGTEFHELRQLQPGDPFKSIAWKASARAGRLLIKEVEQDVQEAHVILVDVGGSVRGGEPGQRKLDLAIENCAALARGALGDGDRVGVVTVDTRPLAHVPLGEGAAQLPRIYDALLGTTEVVDADLTAVLDDEVGELVSRYIRHQDGLDFGPGRDGMYRSLAAHVHRALDRDAIEQQVHADGPEARVLRAFCRARGIPLPHREIAAPYAKAHGRRRCAPPRARSGSNAEERLVDHGLRGDGG